MKIPTNLFKFSFIALGWIVFILLCYVAFKDEKTNVLITMKDSLREAINIDYQERLNKILIHYRPLGRKVKGVQIEYGDSLEIIYFEDSTHESLATQLANQYVMTRIIPVNPDNFNKIFQEEWEKNGVSAAKTGIIYRYNKKKVFSDNDSISFQKALVTPVQAIDAKRTAGVQAWAMIHWTEIVKHTTPKVLWSIIAYFIVLIWVSLSFLKKPQIHQGILNNIGNNLFICQNPGTIMTKGSIKRLEKYFPGLFIFLVYSLNQFFRFWQHDPKLSTAENRKYI